MIVDLLVSLGGGAPRPLRLVCRQVLVRNGKGTPILVAAEHGPDGTQKVAHVRDKDFHRILRELGVHETVVCDRVELPQPPPGARLVSGHPAED